MAGPLTDLKIIEMAGLGPCPLAGQLLADLGAEVTIIDRKSAAPDPTDVNRRNKRSIALNLKSDAGLAVASRLIKNSDVLMEGFRPGVMEKLGLGPEKCHEINPRLIYARMTGWGQSGPLANTAGHDINYLSLTGALHAIGKKDETPVPPLNLVADYAGGTMFLIMGILAALYERQRTGKGDVIDTAMVDCVPLLTGLMHTLLAREQWNLQRENNLLDGGAPFYRVYETKDEKFMSLGALEPQFFAEFIDLAGLPQDHKASQYDRSTWSDKTSVYSQLFRSNTREHWTKLYEHSDACVAPVLDWSEMAEHPHNQSREIFSVTGGVLQANPAPRFQNAETGIPKPPSQAGGDSKSILEELNFSEGEIEQMIEAGVLT